MGLISPVVVYPRVDKGGCFFGLLRISRMLPIDYRR